MMPSGVSAKQHQSSRYWSHGSWAQAHLIGGLQYDLVTGDRSSAAQALRKLAPTYEQMRTALS